jgi:hypothetical protein
MSSILESGANADGLYLSAEPIRRAIMGDDREALLVTSAGLLITVVYGVITLVGLLLMRVVYRICDIALRIGLGARQLDLAKSFASDGVLLCAAAALASMVAIVFANRALQAVAGEQLARLGVASLSARAIVLVGLVILALAESVCILPALFFYGQSTLSRMLRSEGASRGRTQKLLGKSLAIRIALGAPRAHILAHLMFQILRIALSGIVVGAVIAVIALANVPDAIAYTRSAEAASFCVVIGIVAVTSVCAGLAPAIRMMLSDPLEILKV